MKERFLMKDVQPEAFNAMLALEKYLTTTAIEPLHQELIRIRASQLNGCAYCIDVHTKDARKLGETEQRLYLLNAWRESPQFTDAERIILAITEEVTHISHHGLSSDTYQKAVEHFGLETTAQLIVHAAFAHAAQSERGHV